MFVNEIVKQQNFAKTNAFEIQSSKVQKVVIPRSIYAFFSTTTY
jgi:hypothetical protein